MSFSLFLSNRLPELEPKTMPFEQPNFGLVDTGPTQPSGMDGVWSLARAQIQADETVECAKWMMALLRSRQHEPGSCATGF